MPAAETRTCLKCDQSFQPTGWRALRTDNTCPKCSAERALAALARSGKVRAPLSAKQKAHRAIYDARPDQKARRARWRAARLAADPDFKAKVKARSAASRAANDGRLTRLPCEVCGTPEVEAHHDDYGQPLNVRWLCTTHHREHHKRLNALLAA